jgi:WD40 repeat protein
VSANDVAALPDARLLITCTSDGRVLAHDARGGYESVGSLSGHQAAVTNVRINADAGVVITSNGWVLCHDLLAAQRGGSHDALYAVGVAKQGAGCSTLELSAKWAVAGSEDGGVLVLDYASGEPATHGVTIEDVSNC